MKLWQIVALLVAIPVACQIGFVAYVYNVAAEAGLEARRANRALELVIHLSALLRIIVDANADIVDRGWNDFVRKQASLRARFAAEQWAQCDFLMIGKAGYIGYSARFHVSLLLTRSNEYEFLMNVISVTWLS